MVDGLLYGAGDAVIGINPASDNVQQVIRIVHMLDEVIRHYDIPTQSCVLTHITNTIAAMSAGRQLIWCFNRLLEPRRPTEVLVSIWRC
jgi:ethanolamine ammonia-lyase large subunit